jgi:hypothetical protein
VRLRGLVPLAVHGAVDRAADLDELHEPLLREIGEVEVGLELAAVVVELERGSVGSVLAHGVLREAGSFT